MDKDNFFSKNILNITNFTKKTFCTANLEPLYRTLRKTSLISSNSSVASIHHSFYPKAVMLDFLLTCVLLKS